jgi:hypothetical protein
MNKRSIRRLQPGALFPFIPEDFPDEIKGLLSELNYKGKTSDVIRERVTNMNEMDRAIERNGGTKAISLYWNMRPPNRKERTELIKHGFDDSFIKRMTAIHRECNKIDMRATYPINGKWRFFLGFPETDPRTGELRLSVCLAIIHDLATKGLLRRVRECGTCGRWFFAYRPGERYRFCSDACRDKHWRQTPQGRARRAKYTRDYRRRLEEADKAFQKTR